MHRLALERSIFSAARSVTAALGTLVAFSSIAPVSLAQPAPPAASAVAAPVPDALSCGDWLDRVYRLLGIRCTDKVRFGYRGSERNSGPELVELVPATGTERVLWACGECWSPVIVTSGIVVATPDGLALVTTGAETRLVVPIKNVLRILGRTAGTSNQVAFLLDDPKALAVADLDTHESRVIQPMSERDLMPPTIPDQLRRDGSLLRASATFGAPRLEGPHGGTISVSEALDRKQKTDRYLRLDPIWLSNGHVVYVRKPS